MHTLAWVAWVSMVMVIALSTTNPFYLGLLLLCITLIAVLAPKTGTGVAGLRAFFVIGLGLLVISVGIAVVNGSYGDRILFTIPGPNLPWWIGGLRIGGPVSAEGLVAAGTRGMAILSIFLAFAVFNAAVSPQRVLRTAPAALFHAGLVVTVGLTLLPSTIEDLRRIREVQALRGARTGLRQLPALVVPSVISGLERSMRLAEAMEARGYAASPAPSRWPQLIGALSAPLLLASAWGWFYFEEFRAVAALSGLLGAAALACWMWAASAARQTTRLYRESMQPLDRFGIGISLAIAFVAVSSSTTGLADLGYNPFTGLSWPAFSAEGGLIALATLWPAARLALLPAGAEETAVPEGSRRAEVLRP
jgi:energy-coupling factor transport system permease protein